MCIDMHVSRLHNNLHVIQRRNSDHSSIASSDGDSSDNDIDKRLSSGPPLSPATQGLGRISETTEEEAMIEEEMVEDSLPQVPVVSPSQA